jgi:hypothetical protein
VDIREYYVVSWLLRISGGDRISIYKYYGEKKYTLIDIVTTSRSYLSLDWDSV